MKPFRHAAISVFLSALALLHLACAGIPGEMKQTAKSLSSEYYALGEEWMTAKKYDKAIPWYEKARKYSDYYNAATYQIARARVFQKNWPQAKAEYETLLKMDPENTALLSSYAYILASIGDTEEALEIYQRLTVEFEKDISLQKNYITLLAVSGDFDTARRMLEALLAEYPEDNSLLTLQKRVDEEFLRQNPPEEEALPEAGEAVESGEAESGGTPAEIPSEENPPEENIPAAEGSL